MPPATPRSDASALYPQRFWTIVGLARLSLGIGILTVLGYTYALGMGAGRTSLLNFFGFFTNSTSLLTAVVLIAIGSRLAVGVHVPAWLTLARGALAASLIVVGIGYNAVSAVGTAPAWVSFLLHTLVPAAVLLDWALVGDRVPIPWRRVWLVLPYPAAWLGITHYRWIAHEWLPYGFLHPSHGRLMLGLALVGVLVGLMLAAALVWGLSRYSGLAVSPGLVSVGTAESASGVTRVSAGLAAASRVSAASGVAVPASAVPSTSVIASAPAMSPPFASSRSSMPAF